MKISRQSGSLATLMRFYGLKSVFRGNFFFPLFLRLRITLARFFLTRVISDSSRVTKFSQSSSVIVPPTSSRRE